MPRHAKATRMSKLGSHVLPNWGYIAYSAALSLFCAFYLESAYELAAFDKLGKAVGIFYLSPTLGSVVRFCALALVGFVVLVVLLSNRRMLERLFRYRYLVGLALLVMLVVFEVSGSSLSIWGQYLGEPRYQGVLFGTPRIIRSDEWMVSTPFSFSQSTTGSPAISNIIRGLPTDVTMVSPQPSWSLATLFRPFHWGYLILGPSRGLSFFWCVRAVLLVLVSFDCMRLITKDNRYVAAFGALFVGFAPMIEWWSLGGADVLIFGQGLVLALHHLLRAKSMRTRLAVSALLAWLLGCYTLVLYPAWQVPMVYVFGALGIADLVSWLHESTRDERLATLKLTVLPLVCLTVIVFVGVGLSLSQASQSIQAVSHTDYPGQRFETGGGLGEYLANPTLASISIFWPYDFSFNVCENAGFLSLFPLGLILAVGTLARDVRNGRRDAILLALLIPYVFFLVFGLVGFPEFLARISLMSNVTSIRLQLALGYLDVALLAFFSARMQARDQQLAEDDRQPARTWHLWAAVGVDLAFAFLMAFVASRVMPQFANAKAMLIMASTIAVCALPFLLPSSTVLRSGITRGRWVLASAAVVFSIGMCVNPMQRGTDVVSKSPTINRLSEFASHEESPLWITDDHFYGQACILAGIPTITSVNPYPALERWEVFDPDGSSRYAYNRFAHIEMHVGNEIKFENPYDDVLQVTLPPNEIPKLGATHWLSAQDLAAWNTDEVQFVPEGEVNSLTLYRINGGNTKQNST